MPYSASIPNTLEKKKVVKHFLSKNSRVGITIVVLVHREIDHSVVTTFGSLQSTVESRPSRLVESRPIVSLASTTL
jgi:hypothetical protein